MGKKAMEWKQERPLWCGHSDCQFKRRVMDGICGGVLPKPVPHDGDFNTHRFCIKTKEVFDLQVNSADLGWFRWIFDALDGKQTSWLSKRQEGKTPVVCLCGSTRFREAFFSEYARLSDQGYIVLTVSRLIPEHKADSDKQDKIRHELHLRKIDLADEVMILNVGGYIGESTRKEIEYAQKQGKKLSYLISLEEAKLMRGERP